MSYLYCRCMKVGRVPSAGLAASPSGGAVCSVHQVLAISGSRQPAAASSHAATRSPRAPRRRAGSQRGQLHRPNPPGKTAQPAQAWAGCARGYPTGQLPPTFPAVPAPLPSQVIPCTKRFVHDWTICPFAHAGEKAVRRDPRLHNYTGIACPDMKKVRQGGCTWVLHARPRGCCRPRREGEADPRRGPPPLARPAGALATLPGVRRPVQLTLAVACMAPTLCAPPAAPAPADRQLHPRREVPVCAQRV